MPRPWESSVIDSSNKLIIISVTIVKWNKANEIIDEIVEMLNNDPLGLLHQGLEQKRSYLVEYMRTYILINPLYEGVISHLELLAWGKKQIRMGSLHQWFDAKKGSRMVISRKVWIKNDIYWT